MTDPDRYAGGLRLRALDAWVLDSIGLLEAGTADEFQRRRDEIATGFGLVLDDEALGWRAVVEAGARIPEGADAELRRIWAFAVVSAESEGREADALAFVHDVVDSTFGDGTPLA